MKLGPKPSHLYVKLDVFVDCPAGRYRSELQCKPCPVGYYQDKEGQTSCHICQPGHYQPEVAQPACLLCPPGYYQPNNGSGYCDICLPGSYSSEGQLMCTVTSPGQYQPDAGITLRDLRRHYIPVDLSV